TRGGTLDHTCRDDAGPGRPVIGIAALGNAILGLSQRDDALGWSSASLARRLQSATSAERRKLARHLVNFMRAERERVYSADLGIRRLRPESAVARLLETERLAD